MGETNHPTSQPQPVLQAAVIGVVTAGLATATAFGLPLTADQTTAALGLANALAAVVFLIASLRARGKVTPLANPQTVINGETVDLVPEGRHRAEDRRPPGTFVG